MATQFNHGSYRPRSAGRGRNNDPPRYGRPQAHSQPVHISGVMPPRAQVPGINQTGSAPRQVLLHQAPVYVPQSTATAAGNYGGRQYQYMPAGGLIQYPAPAMFNTPGIQYMQQQQPNINLQLGHQATPTGLPMAPVQTQATGLITNQVYQPQQQQQQPQPAKPFQKRERKAIAIVNPDTMKQVDLSTNSKVVIADSEPKPKVDVIIQQPPSSEVQAVAKEFQMKVKSAVSDDSSLRPNAIIRCPDVVKTEETVKQDTVNEDTVNVETVNVETVNEDTVNEDTVNVETVNVETVNEETVKQETVNVETVNQDTANGGDDVTNDIQTDQIEELAVDIVDGCGSIKDPAPEVTKEEVIEKEVTPPQQEIANLDAITSEPAVEPLIMEESNEIVKEPIEAVSEPVEEPPTEDPPGSVEEMTSEPEFIEEPVVEEIGPKKYNRDFLLRFAKNTACLEPPVQLTINTEVFSMHAGKTLTERPALNAMYAGQRPKKEARRGPEPRRISHQPLQTEKVELHKADQRWERPAVTSVETSDIDKQTFELYRKFQGILNKLTPQKFQKLAEQALLLDIVTEERLTGCIDKIFTKALEEPSFSIAYANLCKVLSPLKVEWEEDGQRKQTNFRRVLLTKCQTEFERDKKNDEKLDEMIQALEASTTEEKKKKQQKELDQFEIQARRRSLGNIRFIGELFKLGMLSETIMHECIVRLLKSTSDEESLECFARLITTTGQNLDQTRAKQRIDGYFSRINDIIKKGKIPSRIKFMLQDVQELRRNYWIPRKTQVSTLKTIDQIHAEAKIAEEEDKRMVAQHQALSSYNNKGGRADDRKRGGAEFSTKADREKAPRDKPKMDRTRLERLLKKDNKKDTTPSLGPPSLRPGGGGSVWNRGTQSPVPPSTQDKDIKKPIRSTSSGTKQRIDKPSGRGSGSGPARRGSHSSEQTALIEAVGRFTSTNSSKPGRSESAPSAKETPPIVDLCDEETIRRKTCSIIDELANNGDLVEAVECVTELASPGLLNCLVNEAINHSLEHKAIVRLAAGQLLEKLVKDDILSEIKIMSGLNDILEFAEDIETDVPKMWIYLAEILSPLFQQSTLPLSIVMDLPTQLMDSGKASVLVAEILTKCGSGQSCDVVTKLWTESKLDWTLLGVNSEDVEEFLTNQSLEYLLDSPRPSAPPYYQELSSTISNCDTTNDEVFDWIEKMLSNTKSSEFVNALTKAIVDATVSGVGTSAIFNNDFFMKRATVLKKYVDEDEALQVEILYGLQVSVTTLEHPPRLLLDMFNGLYDMELITEGAFKHWKDQGSESFGKGNCVTKTRTFFDWLDNASIESDEPGDT